MIDLVGLFLVLTTVGMAVALGLFVFDRITRTEFCSLMLLCNVFALGLAPSWRLFVWSVVWFGLGVWSEGRDRRARERARVDRQDGRS